MVARVVAKIERDLRTAQFSCYAQIGIACFTAFWFWHLPAPGWAIGVLAFGAVMMSLSEHISKREKITWILLAGALLVVELRSISYDRQEHNEQFAKTLKAITDGLAKSDQIIAISNTLAANLQVLSQRSGEDKKAITNAWGAASQLPGKALEGAPATLENPAVVQRGKRFVSAEDLGLELKDKEHSAATIINDGTNEAGNFAKQLEIGLRNAGWQVGGDNIKIGDPAFFPDSLTIEVSATPASIEDHSAQEAKNLKAALEKRQIEAALRYTDLRFPPNFMRLKVAGQ